MNLKDKIIARIEAIKADNRRISEECASAGREGYSARSWDISRNRAILTELHELIGEKFVNIGLVFAVQGPFVALSSTGPVLYWTFKSQNLDVNGDKIGSISGGVIA